MAAVETIRRTVPADGEYLMVDGGAERQGATLFLRYQLAPAAGPFRRPLSEQKDLPHWAAGLPGGSRWVVVAYPGRPPALVGRAELPHWLEGTLGRR